MDTRGRGAHRLFMVFTNPGIGTRALVDTLNPEQRESADQHDASVARAELDEAELRSVERTEYYGGGESGSLFVPDTIAPKRGFATRVLDRLRRR